MHIACYTVYGFARAASFPISITRGELETSDVMFITLNRALYTACACVNASMNICNHPAMVRRLFGANKHKALKNH